MRSTAHRVWVEGYAVQGDRCVALLPKSGSQSIQRALGTKCVSAERVLEDCSTRLAFIRNPIARLESNFTYFKFLGLEYGVWAVPVEAIRSWESFVDYTLEHEDDHWKPQMQLVSHQGITVPNVFHRMETMDNVWPDYFSTRIPHINSLSSQAQPSYRMGDLYDCYADDLEKWHEIV